MINQIIKIRKKIEIIHPLIHCITNPISINDCANCILSLGASPIMAEHPREVEEIVEKSHSLCINLGNITDVRIDSIFRAANAAQKNNIPILFDIVGVACSTLRLNYVKDFLKKISPTVIKGNLSEIKALFGEKTNSRGIDVSPLDSINSDTLEKNINLIRTFSNKTNSIIFVSGKTDIIGYKNKVYTISNGIDKMSQVTGTGCMLSAIAATFLASGESLQSIILASAFFSICSEEADTNEGLGTFHIRLIDKLSTISDETITQKANLAIF